MTNFSPRLESERGTRKKINFKEIERILKNIKAYEAKIKDIELEISDLKDLQQISVKAINYDNLIKTNNLFSKTEIQAINDLEIQQTIELLEYKKRHFERFLKKIQNAINSLNDLERKIIKMKCFENKIWRAITFEVNIEERQCREIKKRALNKISNLIIDTDIITLN